MSDKRRATFPMAFWAANTMEIFERMAWYGFFAVSTLYLTGKTSDGGLGFSSQDRGVIQGLATFFLYLFPALFGALADRFGYRLMFFAACAVMIPGYLLLGYPTSFWGFFAVYFLVAVGHGMFKPVVISTITKTTTPETGSMGFGIFYMMVNIGGFIGPIVAGVLRGWEWKYVFYASAGWVACVAVCNLLLYREPERDSEAEVQRPLNAVLAGMVGVVGNGRFFLFVVGLLSLLVMGSKWIPIGTVSLIALGWAAVNLGLDALLRRSKPVAEEAAVDSNGGSWLGQPMRIGEGRYLLFLLLMSGFWTSFNQIFMTLPEFIRDYVNTHDLIDGLGPVAGWVTATAGALGFDTSSWGKAVLKGGQLKPEHLINLNAFGIIIGQVAISYLSRRWKPLTTMIIGSIVTVLSFLVLAVGMTGWLVVAGLLVFSVGEMLASPKSKEYAGRIAPPDKVGMYMGYFYWSVALGNLFGGLLSGTMYGYFGPKGIDRPGIMWALFGLLGVGSAVGLWLYNRWVSGRDESGREQPAAP